MRGLLVITTRACVEVGGFICLNIFWLTDCILSAILGILGRYIWAAHLSNGERKSLVYQGRI